MPREEKGPGAIVSVKDHVKCQHPGCDSRGTHKIVLILMCPAAPGMLECPSGFVRDFREVEGWRRCLAHQPKTGAAYFEDHPAWWGMLAESFARRCAAKHGFAGIAVRELTQVHYLDEDGEIEDIELYAVVDAGVEGERLERAGTIKAVLH